MAVRRLSSEPVGVPTGGHALSALLIGASAGGPQRVEQILRHLPADFRAPVAVCQHMPLGFTKTWAERLDGLCNLRVREARFGEAFEPGGVYLAPIGKHMRFERDAGGAVRIRLDSDFADSLHVPSIDIMMSSAAQTMGSRTLAVLLSGFGSDGATGMLAVRRAGGHTISEASDTALAASMPSSAVKIGAAAEEVSAHDMPQVVVDRVAGRF